MNHRIAIASDLHFHAWSAFSTTNADGINSRLQYTLDDLEATARRIGKSGRLYLAGDLFHVRGSLAPSVLNAVIDRFQHIRSTYETDIRVIPGNHDLESKDSRRLTNACQALEQVGCRICTEPTFFEDDSLVMVPWMATLDEVRQALRDARNQYDAKRAIIHAPVNGVLMGIPDHGLDAAELEKYGYERIFAGHFHNHKVLGDGTVISIGALNHQTWGDVGTLAGAIVLQDDWTGAEHIASTAPEFIDFDLSWTPVEIESCCEGNYVRVKLASATELEIQQIRQGIIDAGALGVVVHAKPETTLVSRTNSTVKAGASISQSIQDWIAAAKLGVDEKAVFAECEDVLACAATEEV